MFYILQFESLLGLSTHRDPSYPDGYCDYGEPGCEQTTEPSTTRRPRRTTTERATRRPRPRPSTTRRPRTTTDDYYYYYSFTMAPSTRRPTTRPSRRPRPRPRPRNCLEDNTAYYGNNLNNFRHNMQRDSMRCMRQCRNTRRCAFWLESSILALIILGIIKLFPPEIGKPIDNQI